MQNCVIESERATGVEKVSFREVALEKALFEGTLRGILETAFEKVPRRVLRSCLAVGFRGRKGSEKGSQKGVLRREISRRHLVGRNTPASRAP